jgi:hypothetical protein
VNTTPLQPFSAAVLWFVAVNALAGAGSLLLFPAHTDTLFFWRITPPLNAALFGALYLGGALAVGLVARGGRWEPGRILAPVLVSAGALISAVTLLHRQAFHADLRLLYWLAIYVGAPLLAIVIYWRQERAGAVWAVEQPLAPAVRRLAVLVGALLLALGLAILLRPGPLVAAWPWPTGPLMARIFAAWFAAFGVGLLWFQVDQDWSRVRLIADLLLLAAALDLAVLAIHRADIPGPSLGLWLYIGHLVGLGALGVLMRALQRRWARRAPALRLAHERGAIKQV